MAVRRGRKPAPTPKSEIHIIYRTHPPGEPFLRKPLPDGTRSLVVEDSLRVRGRQPIDPDEFYETKKRYIDSQAKTIRALHAGGIPTFIGESITNHPDPLNLSRDNALVRWVRRKKWNRKEKQRWKTINDYQQLKKEARQRHRAAFDQPTLTNLRAFFHASARQVDFREQLVVDTLASVPKPTVARYGSTHGRITELLRRKGIPSTREMEEQVFMWDLIVERKILMGKKPTPIEMQRGFISTLLDQESTIRRIIGKSNKPITDKDVRFGGAVLFALLSRVNEKDIPALMSLRHNPSLVYPALLEHNKLPPVPMREEWEAFVRKNVYVYNRKPGLVKR